MPINRGAFSMGLSRLAVACQKTLDDATLEVYFEGLAKRANPDTWDAFTRRAATDDTFRQANGELWFPKLPDLIDEYQRAKHEHIAGLLAAEVDTRSKDEKRADAVRMLDVVKAAVSEREKELPPSPIVTAPRESKVVDLDQYDERLDKLRRQAREIGGATAVPVEEMERA